MTADVLLALAYFVVALLIAHLQIAWLNARDAKAPLRAANIDAVLTALHYVPLALLIVTENWLVILGDVAANWCASYTGVKKTNETTGPIGTNV